LFESKFVALWNTQYQGDLFSYAVTAEEKSAAQTAFLREVLSDSLGYAGTKMMRRIIGVAKVEDMKSIKDETIKAASELQALRCGRALVLGRASLTIKDVIALATKVNQH